ncbi:MAG: ferritin-like domain-containing protein, partial [Haloplanus sp.]
DNLREHASVDPEDEDVYGIRDSLENDMEMYGDIIETMRDHVDLARGLGDHATAELLRQQLLTLEEHAHHLEHYLEDDTLVVDSATH